MWLFWSLLLLSFDAAEFLLLPVRLKSLKGWSSDKLAG